MRRWTCRGWCNRGLSSLLFGWLEFAAYRLEGQLAMISAVLYVSMVWGRPWVGQSACHGFSCALCQQGVGLALGGPFLDLAALRRAERVGLAWVSSKSSECACFDTSCASLQLLARGSTLLSH